MINVENEKLLKGTMQIQDNESIRNAISNGSDVCISILGESTADTFTTAETLIYSYNQLLERANSIE